MTSVRLRTCAAGGAVALTAGLLVDNGSVLGSDLPETALLGVLAGAVVALVPGGALLGRVGGFLLGVAAAWFGYAFQAGFLPDIPAGHAVAAVSVVVLVTAVAVATAERLPLWSGFVGAATLIGAYQTQFATHPTAFVSESTTAVTTVLAASALGLLVTSLIEDLMADRGELEGPPGEVIVPAPRATVDLTDIDLREGTGSPQGTVPSSQQEVER